MSNALSGEAYKAADLVGDDACFAAKCILRLVNAFQSLSVPAMIKTADATSFGSIRVFQFL